MRRLLLIVFVILGAALAFIGGWAYSNRTMLIISDHTGSALASSLGELAQVFRRDDLSNGTRVELGGIMREQALILIALGPNVENFDSNGFKGICRLISESELLFRDDGVEPVWQQANRLIRAQLAKQKEVVTAELMRRRARPAAPPSCPGFDK
jgi:hypothetical protein